jgi:hypothetical protein
MLGSIKRSRSKVAKARAAFTGHGNPGERKLQVEVRVWRASVPGFYVSSACLKRGPGKLTAGSARQGRRCSMGKRSGTPTGAIKNALRSLGARIK